MEVDPVVHQAIALLDSADFGLIERSDSGRDPVPRHCLWFVNDGISAFPCPIAQLDVFPVKGRVESIKPAEAYKLLPVEHGRAAAGKHRMERLLAMLF